MGVLSDGGLRVSSMSTPLTPSLSISPNRAPPAAAPLTWGSGLYGSGLGVGSRTARESRVRHLFSWESGGAL